MVLLFFFRVYTEYNYLNWHFSRSLHCILLLDLALSGSIHMDGAAATGSDAGGGSGGTISIKTKVLEGHGDITAIGGKGTGVGGGGAGGRVFLEIES